MSAVPARASRPVPRMELVTVDPGTARVLLEGNGRNRRLRPTMVARYAEDMRAGRWRHPTGEPLVVDADGTLQDGQHRLHALVAAGVTLRFWVLWDADPDDFAVIDQGAKRSARDVIGIDGIAHSKEAAAVARLVLLRQRFPAVQWPRVNPQVTTAEVVEWTRARPSLAEWAGGTARGLTRAGFPGVPLAAVAVSVALLSGAGDDVEGASMELHDRWLVDVSLGANLALGCPALALRDWVARTASGNAADRAARRDQQVRFAVVSKAWNSYARGQQMYRLHWSFQYLPMPGLVPSRPLPDGREPR